MALVRAMVRAMARAMTRPMVRGSSVTPPPGGDASLDFSDANNSMYVALLEDI